MELQLHASVDLPPILSGEEMGGLQNRCGFWEMDLDSLVIQFVA